MPALESDPVRRAARGAGTAHILTPLVAAPATTSAGLAFSASPPVRRSWWRPQSPHLSDNPLGDL